MSAGGRRLWFQHTKDLRQLLTNIVLSVIVAIVGLASGAGNPFGALAMSNPEPLKVGFVLAGSTSDLDWNYAHDQGRKYLEKVLKDQAQTQVVERVPESAEVERVMEKMIAQGTKLIFSTGFGYLEPALRVAARHPEVIVMQCERSCPASAKNAGSYFAVDYAPLYVAGIVAGRMTRKGRLGFVAGHPIPAIVTGLNVFAMLSPCFFRKIRSCVNQARSAWRDEEYRGW
jgi:basic membrane lipoprotein Med (substrate-binding protein (PBP1-ABC) superfamily)